MISPAEGRKRLKSLQKRSFERPLTPAETAHAAKVAASLEYQGVDLKAAGLTLHLLGITEAQQQASRDRRYSNPGLRSSFVEPTRISTWRRKIKRA